MVAGKSLCPCQVLLKFLPASVISGGSTLPFTSTLTVANTEIFSLPGPGVAFYAVSPRFVITLHFEGSTGKPDSSVFQICFTVRFFPLIISSIML